MYERFLDRVSKTAWRSRTSVNFQAACTKRRCNTCRWFANDWPVRLHKKQSDETKSFIYDYHFRSEDFKSSSTVTHGLIRSSCICVQARAAQQRVYSASTTINQAHHLVTRHKFERCDPEADKQTTPQYRDM